MSQNNIEQQGKDLKNLLAQLITADTLKIEQVRSLRKIVNSELESTPDIINKLKTKIQNKKP